MYKNILRKEFLKLDKLLLALLVVHVAVAIYYIVDIRGDFLRVDAIAQWTIVITRQVIFFDFFEKPLLAAALAIGILQFFPEIEKKRFRISCHLPMNEYKMTGTTIFFGLSMVTILWLFDLVVAYCAGSIYYPREISSEIPVIMFYWYIQAVIIYIFAAIITLEPLWKVKIRLGILLYAYHELIYVNIYNSTPRLLVVITLLALAFIPIIYYPAMRFRKGV